MDPPLNSAYSMTSNKLNVAMDLSGRTELTLVPILKLFVRGNNKPYAYLSLKPFMCMIFICLDTVLLPDSPQPGINILK